MTRDLAARVAAAQAEADADREPRCQWCAATGPLQQVPDTTRPELECVDRAACHARVLKVVGH